VARISHPPLSETDAALLSGALIPSYKTNGVKKAGDQDITSAAGAH